MIRNFNKDIFVRVISFLFSSGRSIEINAKKALNMIAFLS